MKVIFKFFTRLREITGKKEEEIEVQESVTIKDALKLVSERHSHQFKNYLYDENERVQSHLLFLVNGRSITDLHGFKTKLKDGDKVAILPPMSGG